MNTMRGFVVPLLFASFLVACGGGSTPAGDLAPADPGFDDPGTPDPGPDVPGDVSRPDEAPVDPGAGDPGLADVPADPGLADVPADPGPADLPGEAAPGDEAPPADLPCDEGPLADLPGDPAGDAAAPVRVVVSIGSAADAVSSYLMDANEGAWNYFGGADVPIGRHWDVAHVSYHTALRFPGVPVPAGATVRSATLSFQPIGPFTGTKENLWIDVRAERQPDSAPFDPANYDSGRPDQRLKTVAKVPPDTPDGKPNHWLVRCNDTCTDLTEWDCPQRQKDCWDRDVRYDCPKDLAPLVQEVVDLPGWAPGNAITIFLLNAATDEDGPNYQDHRTFTGYDPERGVEFRPTLAIEYGEG